jgi:DNA-binding transcriptional LysR family regulator
MWRDVELRELRIFLVLGEELHFGRTAERLGISQPGVSEAVRVLESRLGVKVFDRTSRRVRLTPAGEGLKRRLVPALAALDQALIETSELSHAVRGLLRIGFVLTTEGPALSRLIAAFQASYPACEVRPQEVDTFDAYRALHRDDVDLLCNWLAVDQPDLTAGAAFAYYPRALAVAASHRLAAHNTVSVEDLADEEVALLPPSIPSAVYDLIVPPRLQDGPSAALRLSRPSTRSSRWWPAVVSSTPLAPRSRSSTATTSFSSPSMTCPPCHWVWSGAPAERIHASAPSTKSPAQWPLHPAPTHSKTTRHGQDSLLISYPCSTLFR